MAQKSALDKATLESYLRHEELWIKDIGVKIDDAKPSTAMPGYFDVTVHLTYNGATKDQLFYISKDGRKIVKGEVFDINRNPFQDNLNLLKTAGQPNLGPANAPVQLVMFSDFQCPICKEEGEILRANLMKTFPDKVHLVFIDFPLEQIHNWSRTAAVAGVCVARQSPAKFWDYFDWTYENQGNLGLDNFSDHFQSFAKGKGLDGMQLGRCVDDKAADAEVTRELAEGHKLQVDATPTIFMNGRKIQGGLPWPTMEQLINIEIDHQTEAARQAKASDDSCCEVKIPTILK
ncbi:MAG: thioredoxin domain-containing protein [Bryobacteraceae bacterium]